jgi:4-hydroxybutyrate dehydrogenase
MKSFRLKTKINQCDSFADFAKEFEIGKSDLLITHGFLYSDYMAPCHLGCHTIFQEDFGTGEPNDLMVDNIINKISDMKYNRIVAVGGGSVIDIAKLLSIKDVTCTEDIFEDKIPMVRDKKLIIVPTTCGSGSEMTSIIVVDIKKKKSKIGKSVDAFFADDAVLIPELLTKLPYHVFLHCTIDALVHAMEIYVSPMGNDFNDVLCAEAVSLILTGFKDIIDKGPQARLSYLKEYQTASCMAGAAMANTACGAVHACAMHFGSKHHVPHGEANYTFLTSVFKKYAKLQSEGKIQKIADIINKKFAIRGDTFSSFEALDKLLNSLIKKKGLNEYGIDKASIEEYVDKVIETQQRLLKNSYVSLSRDDLIEIYETIY